MPDYSMDNDPAYWHVPERFKELAEFVPTIGVRGAWFPMGDEDDDDVPMAHILHMKPGYVIKRHAHPCERFEVVLRGSIHADGQTLVPGDIMTAHPNEFYGPKTAGPDGCTTLEVFATIRGSFTRVTEDENGGHVITNLLEDQAVLSRKS